MAQSAGDVQVPPTVTFTIPMYNEEKRARRCLSSIRNQDYPQDRVEIIVADGGSRDRTVQVVREYGVKVVTNPERLAEFGLKKAMLETDTELAVVFAADNEIAAPDWLRRVAALFSGYGELSAAWGRIIAAPDDPPVNRYYALIQSEPLTFFVNRNLERYLAEATALPLGEPAYAFRVDPSRPLPWGANGLVYRMEHVRASWEREGYMGDNDAFQSMLSRGHDLVAYLPELTVYHHCLESLGDWKRKMERNFNRHFIEQYESRDMTWAFPAEFRRRFALWLAYSLFLPASLAHSAYLAISERQPLWLYHPVASLMQALVYVRCVAANPRARKIVREILVGAKR